MTLIEAAVLYFLSFVVLETRHPVGDVDLSHELMVMSEQQIEALYYDGMTHETGPAVAMFEPYSRTLFVSADFDATREHDRAMLLQEVVLLVEESLILSGAAISGEAFNEERNRLFTLALERESGLRLAGR